MLRVARQRVVMVTFDSEALEELWITADYADHFFAALWARPELLFDEEVVRPMWVWQSISEQAREAGRERLAADLASGAWDERYGRLRELSELDVGLRLVVAMLG